MTRQTNPQTEAALPPHQELTTDDGHLTVRTWYDERSELTHVEVISADGAPVRTAELQRLPLNQMRARHIHYAAHPAHSGEWPPVWHQPASIEDRIKITRPDGTRAWRKEFADRYRYAATFSAYPAKAMAIASGIPVSAIHRYAREARLRGDLLSPNSDEDSE
jgi:hypothetical protein